MSKLTKHILTEIQTRDLHPIPRRQFIFWHILAWTAVTLCIIFGAISFGIVLTDLLGTEWEFATRAAGGSAEAILLALPYIWLVLLTLTLFLVRLTFRRTRRGYRYSSILILAASVLLSVLLGTAAYATGLSTKFENFIYHHFSPYRSFRQHLEKRWNAPDRGALLGLPEYLDGRTLTLTDLSGQTWLVDLTDLPAADIAHIDYSQPLAVLGTSTGSGTFHAEHLPHPGRTMMRPHPDRAGLSIPPPPFR